MPINVTDISAVLGFAGIAMRLINEGAMTVKRLREIAAAEGATPEELADLDKRLSAAIARRSGSPNG